MTNSRLAILACCALFVASSALLSNCAPAAQTLQLQASNYNHNQQLATPNSRQNTTFMHHDDEPFTHDTQAARQQQLQLQHQRAAPYIQQTPSTTTNNTTNAWQLHFGAEISISVLVGIVLLALIATLADVATTGAEYTFKTTNETTSTTTKVPNYATTTSQQPRDERSPSLSSSSSSTFSASANSLRSASSPILTAKAASRRSRPFARLAQRLSVSGATSGFTSATFGANKQRKCQKTAHLDLAAHLTVPHSLISVCHDDDDDDDDEEEEEEEENFATMKSHKNNHNNSNEPIALRLLLAFSLRANTKLIFRTSKTKHDQQHQATKNSNQSVDALHGLRFLSMVWIIAVHSYSFALRWLSFSASPETLSASIYTKSGAQLLANGTFACDTFLFAGGFLVAHGSFPLSSSNQLPKQQQPPKPTPSPLKKLIANVAHRYVRMAPLMMAIIGLSATLLRYFDSGPAWHSSTLMFDDWCRRNWWTNALFVQNFIGRENMCLSHSWYSAVDMQLFVVAQLLVLALCKWPRLTLGMCVGLTFGSQITTGALTIAHKLPAVPLLASVPESTMNLYFAEVYVKPYCRAAPYLIGLMLAYAMRTTRLGTLKLSSTCSALGWTLCACSMSAIVMAMQPAMADGFALSPLQSALYSSLSRPLWAVCVGWIVFACASNKTALVARLLGAKSLAPLARLTYPAFLIHPIVIAMFYGSRADTTFAFSHYLMLYFVIGNIVITYAVSYILALLFELPLQNVERELRLQRRRRQHFKDNLNHNHQQKQHATDICPVVTIKTSDSNTTNQQIAAVKSNQNQHD